MVAQALVGILNMWCPGPQEEGTAVESPLPPHGQNLDRPMGPFHDGADKQSRCLT